MGRYAQARRRGGGAIQSLYLPVLTGDEDDNLSWVVGGPQPHHARLWGAASLDGPFTDGGTVAWGLGGTAADPGFWFVVGEDLVNGSVTQPSNIVSLP
jgi:hypothetical protein